MRVTTVVHTALMLLYFFLYFVRKIDSSIDQRNVLLKKVAVEETIVIFCYKQTAVIQKE